MALNISTIALPQSENLKLHILLERDNQEKVTASVLEFPSFQIQAPTDKQALEPEQTMPVQTKAQVLSVLQEYRQELHRFGVSRCGIFGSFVRDSAIDDQSDVDILVAFEPDQKTFDNFMHLSFFLEDIFGRKVDLVTIESLSPYIGPHILDEVEYVSISA